MPAGGVTVISKEREFDIEWKILNYYTLSSYDSPVFSFNGDSWKLEILPNSGNYIDLRLHRLSDFSPLINVEFSFAFKNVDGKKDLGKHSAVIFKGVGFHSINRFLSRSDFLNRKSEFVSSEFLTVVCTLQKFKSSKNAGDIAYTGCSSSKRSLETDTGSSRKEWCKNISPKYSSITDIKVFRIDYHQSENANKKGNSTYAECSSSKISFDTDTVSSCNNWCSIKCPKCSSPFDLKFFATDYDESENEKVDKKSESSMEPLKYKALQDYKELLLKQEDCDIIIKVKEQEFPAHRVILKARSPVLASAFRNDMKEKVTGIIDIEDCDASHFSDFLYFLYCGEVENLTDKNVFGLFTLADKYDVPDLKNKCMAFIKHNLSIDTFCNAVTLALLHSETELIKLIAEFFAKNMKKIVVTVEWQSFITKNPIQGNEILIKALECNS